MCLLKSQFFDQYFDKWLQLESAGCVDTATCRIRVGILYSQNQQKHVKWNFRNTCPLCSGNAVLLGSQKTDTPRKNSIVGDP